MRLSALAEARSGVLGAFGADAHNHQSTATRASDAADATLSHHTQQQKREAAELATAINMYCRFCTDVSVNSDDIGPSFCKMIVVFQKNVNVRVAYAALFEMNRPAHTDNALPTTAPTEAPIASSSSFLDWERAPLLERDKVYSDAVSWVRALTRYIEIVGGPKTDSELRALLRERPSLQHFDECLRGSGLGGASSSSSAGEAGFELLVRLYLLVSVRKLQTLHAMEQFFSITQNRDAHREAMHFFSLLANRQFDHDEQTRVLVLLMARHVRVRARCVQQELELMQLREQELEGLFKQKSMRALTGRPKLRSKLRAHSAASGSLFSMDQLAQWNGNIRFPNVFSMKQRKRLYFVMAQTHLDPHACMHALLRDRELAATVLRYPVKQPEIEVLHECIVACRIVSDPFPELHQFRASCFDSFAHEHKARLRLNDLLHLFLSAYQNPSVWKSVWKLVFPVLTIQIIRDVEAFVSRVPFPYEPVLAILFEQRLDFQTAWPSSSSSRAPSIVPGTPAPPLSPTGSQASFALSSRPVSPLPTPVAVARPELGAEGPQAERVGGEDHHAADGVRNPEPPGDERVPENADLAAPLARDNAAEPGLVDAGESGHRVDVALRLAREVDHVEDQHAGQAVLQEELGPEHAVGGAGGLQHAGDGVGDVAHVTGGHVHDLMLWPTDEQDGLGATDQPGPEQKPAVVVRLEDLLTVLDMR